MINNLLSTANTFNKLLKKAEVAPAIKRKIISILEEVVEMYKNNMPELGIQEVNLDNIDITQNYQDFNIYFQINVDSNKYEDLVNNSSIKTKIINMIKMILDTDSNLKQVISEPLFNVNFTFFPV